MKILYRRGGWESAAEFEICREVFGDENVTLSRMIPKNEVVIGRYSVLPHYQELVRDLDFNNCKLINSYQQHKWIVDCDWINDLKDYTFETFFDYNFHLSPEDRYIVKGKVNSRKEQWDTLMYAPNKIKASEIAAELCHDPLINPQGIIYRRFHELEKFGETERGTPIVNEWRIFILDGKIVSSGFYWKGFIELDNSVEKDFQRGGMIFVGRILNHLSDCVDSFSLPRFLVIDIAKDVHGKWWVVEVNDGQMSGLQGNSTRLFYTRLRELVESGSD